MSAVLVDDPAVTNNGHGYGTSTLGPTIPPLWSGLLLGGLFFLPAALGFLFEGTSFATGTAIICVTVLALSTIGIVPLSARDVQMAFAVTTVAAFIIVLHLLIADAINNDPSFDFRRAFFSLILFGIVALGTPAISVVMIGSAHIRTLVRTLCVLFIMSAILSILGLQPPTASLGEKPTFPYTEPSFLGFSFIAVLVFTLIRASTVGRALLICVFIGLGLALSNLTIITACVLAAAVTLPVSWLMSGFVIALISVASIDITYYTDRLDFDWANSTNLSALVYVQGWQMLQEALHRTDGWGVGFQQLGIVYSNVPASVRINALLGRDANLQDGGFILSKIGSEFGYFGFILIGFYLYFMVKSATRLRLAAWHRTDLTDGELFAHTCVFGYVIEVFIRGTNYFTGTFVLMVASLLYLKRMKTGVRL